MSKLSIATRSPGAAVEVTEAERVVLSDGVGGKTGPLRGNRRGTGQALAPSSEAVGVEQLLHGGLSDLRALLPEAIGELATTDPRLEDPRTEQLVYDMGRGGVLEPGLAPRLRREGVETVVIGEALPLVVAGPADAHLATGFGHIAELVVEREQATSAVAVGDDLVWGHGGGLLGLCARSHSIHHRPHQVRDMQPQPADRKA